MDEKENQNVLEGMCPHGNFPDSCNACVTDREQASKAVKDERQKIAERVAQSFSSRLCEYLTGMTPDNPAMVERLQEDQKILRSKYRLPSQDLPPAEFQRALKRIAKSIATRIKPTSEFGKFFKEYPIADAVHFENDRQIGVDINRDDLREYRRSLSRLEHELIHGLQNQGAPSMPIELKEYEAYVANMNVDYMKAHPEDIDDILFGALVGASVDLYYQYESQKMGKEILPEWNNPAFFLGRDGIDPSKIKNVGAEQNFGQEDF
ncbi:hypothetical protein COV04_04270 [Candidatus Uhrbacteria bacterium CG10_big_fil_rev_8_21_14_0_10_48_11]|uniref:Uncharacterized protein n=1 Tax=Candidatus Uhrbacteria bacterium CG10_big_fil_rev_8_21_14_0_10_48_11 TaxID=1975037 RepID=A0A2M8LDT3_9BACT|nr:MAG: hypothetical protein COV04_04270 [Candidatus Uhrbacteria bacterium CG10_big_fil_rev_8_21_14_0_10_48_11]